MILVFAGAGASKAVSEVYPTTKEFFEQLPDQIKNDTLFGLIKDWLLGRFGQDAVVDIEQFLWALSELREFVSRVGDEKTLEGWMLRGSRLVKPLRLNTDFSNLFGNAHKLLGLTDKLIGSINEGVYNCYSHEPSVEELRDNWFVLLEPLLASQRVELFTTNYDLVLETAVELLAEQSTTLPRVLTGRAGRVKHYLDEHLWAPPPRGWEWSSPGGKLTKLHGSVDWTRGEDRIYVGDPTFKGAHQNQVILYPGFKGRPEAEPFISFHSYFRDCLQAAQAAVFIGFAFRDEHINDLIERWLAPRARVIVINPAENLKVPVESRRIENISKYFVADVARETGESLVK
jgi:SIR2-like domain